MSLRILEHIVFIILLLIIVGGVTTIIAPFHESFHWMVCKGVGLEPEFHFFVVPCDGIKQKSNIVKFFFHISPYMFWALFMTIGYVYWKKNRVVKYLLLIPAFDIIFNFIKTFFNFTDFFNLAYNTKPNTFYLYLSILLVVYIGYLTFFKVILKLRVWDYRTFEKNWKVSIFKKK